MVLIAALQSLHWHRFVSRLKLESAESIFLGRYLDGTLFTLCNVCALQLLLEANHCYCPEGCFKGQGGVADFLSALPHWTL